MGQMIEVARSAVQTWECDQMGHMNVQFYVAKAGEGLTALAAALGLSPRAQRSDLAALFPREHHIRFHRELRPSAPFAVTAGVIDTRSEGLILYEEMHNVANATLTATFVTRAEWCDVEHRGGLPLPVNAIAKAPPLTVDLPPHGRPRGLDLAPPRPAPKLNGPVAERMMTTLRGAVPHEHCDAQGFMTTRHYIGRISDAIPNLLAQTRGHDRTSGSVGGAALEYRIVYRSPARGGDLLVVKSGLKSVSAKTYVWCHWLFDGETGDCLATAEAVAVPLDLTERKAIEIPADMRAHLESLVLPGLSV
jgi:acyl-CoA thioester hydrolase